MNIVNPILRQASLSPDQPALALDKLTISYGELRAYARAASYWLRESGVARGDRVALLNANPFEQTVAALACAWVGATVVDVPNELPPTSYSAVFRRVEATAAILCEKDGVPTPEPSSLAAGKSVLFSTIYKPVPAGVEVPPPASDVADDLWRVTFSSGTTGEPKAIGWTHRASNLLSIQMKSVYRFGPGQRLLIAISTQVQFASNYWLAGLQSGSCIVFPSANGPAAILEDIRKHEATQMITSGAICARLAQHVSQAEPGTHRVSPGLKVVSAGGGVIASGVLNVMRARVAPEMYCHYGSSETGYIARTNQEMQLKAPLLSGMLAQWMEGEAVDDEDRPLPPGTIGRLRFRTTAMTAGYIGDPAATAKSFKDGWFYPGDLGAITHQGFLALAGRIDDRLNLGGVKVNPLTIEKIINAHADVVESAVTVGRAGGIEILVGLLVMKEGADSQRLQAEIKSSCVDKLGKAGAPSVFMQVPALPASPNGKINRAELPALFAAKTPVQA